MHINIANFTAGPIPTHGWTLNTRPPLVGIILLDNTNSVDFPRHLFTLLVRLLGRKYDVEMSKLLYLWRTNE